ncbi:MAG: TonB-dependent receptor [Ginsengibacter sp.]
MKRTNALSSCLLKIKTGFLRQTLNGTQFTIFALIVILCSFAPGQKLFAAGGFPHSLKHNSALDKTIHGKVTNESGQPVSSVSVYVKGNSSNGTITDANGDYTLQLPNNASVLVFSSVGMETVEVPINNKTEINAILKVKELRQDEVIVIGYGTQKKRDLTGAVSSIKSENLNLGGTTANIGQAIQGRATGVVVQQTSFAPGAGLAITIRGGNSFSGSNAPLYVIDGFITSNINQINPDDIASIDILKDASATAIYGARGSNGVVLITTKKGTSGKLLIEGSISHGTQDLTYNPKFITGQQYVDVKNAIAAEDLTTQPFPVSFIPANTNWWTAATRSASVDNQGVNLSSNYQGSKIFVSVNHLKQTGVLENTGFERYSARIGAERSISDKVKIGGNFYGANGTSDLQPYTGDITAPLFSLLVAPAAYPIYNANGSYYNIISSDIKGNPLASLIEPTDHSVNRTANANMYFDYEIIKNLTYHIDGGVEYSNTDEGKYTPRTISVGAVNGGIASEALTTTTRWLVQQYATYKYSFKEHRFNFLLGTSNQRDEASGLTANAKGFVNDDLLYYNLGTGSTLVKPSNYKNPPYLLTSYFGRVNYSYNSEILFTFNGRRDQSSLFGPGKRSDNFFSGALAWNMSDKDFIRNLNTFSNLKIRVGYGTAGNDRIATANSIPPYIAALGQYSTVLMPGGALQIGFEPNSLPNNGLVWEKTGQLNIGLDMGFANNRINATVDFYSKKTHDNSLLFNIPVGQWWGLGTQSINAGSISNRGIELSVSSDNIKTKDFTWSTMFNISYNKQKVVSFAPGISLISTNTANPSGTVSGQEFTRAVIGKELGVLYGYQYLGVIKTGEKYAAQPNSKPGDPKYADLNGDGKITPDDREFLGNTTPHYTLGFSNQLQYKGIGLNIFLQSALGYKLYNMNRLVLESSTGTDVLKRFVAGTNENTNVPREGYYKSIYGSYVNSRFVEDASYLRVKMVSLSYNIPVNLIKQLNFIEGLQVYVNAQNLATITKYTGTDPEVNVHTSNTGGGLDFGVFPAFRTFEFGAKITIR